jgi:hypothetical protein
MPEHSKCCGAFEKKQIAYQWTTNLHIKPQESPGNFHALARLREPSKRSKMATSEMFCLLR